MVVYLRFFYSVDVFLKIFVYEAPFHLRVLVPIGKCKIKCPPVFLSYSSI